MVNDDYSTAKLLVDSGKEKLAHYDMDVLKKQKKSTNSSYLEEAKKIGSSLKKSEVKNDTDSKTPDNKASSIKQDKGRTI